MENYPNKSSKKVNQRQFCLPSNNISKLRYAFICLLFLCGICYLTVYFKLFSQLYVPVISSLSYLNLEPPIIYHYPLSNEVETQKTTEKLMTERDYVQKATKYVLNIPPVPYIYGDVAGGPKYLKNNTCALFPHIFRLKFDNTIWQIQKQTNWTFYLFTAFWDIRKLEPFESGPSIQILGMMDRTDENMTKHFCQVWFENKTEPLITEISHYRYVWNRKWGNYKDGEMQPYLFNCRMPQSYSGQIPFSVSLVPSACTHATNNLRIHFDKPKRKEIFGVCVKGMDFITPDWSIRLIEWIELLLILGVHKIYFYDLAVHPNVQKVFKYYQDLKKIEVYPLTHPGGVPNEPNLRHAYLKRQLTIKRQHELIPYNDCLYRNMYKYEYISLLDIDEIIIPHNGMSSWYELLTFLQSTTENQETSNFLFGNVFFTGVDETYPKKDRQNIPHYMYMLQHTTRNSKEVGRGSGVKCFLRPENILTMHNHWPTGCVKPCAKVFANLTDGFLHHYRTRDAGGIISKGNETITYDVDETLWKWKDQLILKTNKALTDLGLIP